MSQHRPERSGGFLFNGFRFDSDTRELFRVDEAGGLAPVTVGSRPLALLRLLVTNPGRLVSKAEIMDAVWRGVIVEEANLTVQIAALRRILDRDRPDGSCIQTVPGRGYRFVAPVVADTEKDGGMAMPPSNGARRDPTPTPEVGPERRQISALCCELTGICRRDDADLDDLREAVAAFHECVAETVRRRNGVIARRFGNVVLAVFGYPAADETDAEQAVHAGLEVCAAVEALRPVCDAAPLRCRVGIATGTVVIGRVGGGDGLRDLDIVGDCPNVAGRLLLSLPPGGVAIETATRRLIGELFTCRDLGATAITGGIEPVRLWQVLEEGIVASRFEAFHPIGLTPLVGREEEINHLLRRWCQAKSGEGQIVLLAGEPGIGKSRVAVELLQRTHPEPCTRLRYFCSPHNADSALHPTISQLQYAAGFGREDSSSVKLDKLAALLSRTAATREEVALFAELLSLPTAGFGAAVEHLSPRQKRERILAALVRQLEALARGPPVLVLFEDVHWADPSSLELLDYVIEQVPRLPVLFVISFRPDYHPPWVGQPSVSSLALARLARSATALLAGQVAGGKALPGAIINQIVDRAEGVPLFVEELTKSLLESGLLREERERYVLNGALRPLAVPTTLQDPLTARLDRLGVARRVAQIGAAIGREFSYPLLRAVSRLPDSELEAALASLVASELVFQRGAPPDAVYRFKHALVQEAAHDGLLRNPRRQLHAQIVEALETHSPELMENQPAVFARHYADAGLIEKSITYWGKAGHRSIARSAMAEAATQYQKALEQLALLPDTPKRQWQQLEFWSALGMVLRAVKGQAATESGQAYSRARQLWEQLGSPSDFLWIPHALSLYHMIRGELHLALRLDEELLHLSRQREDSAGLVLSHHSSGRNLMVAGRLAASRSHLEAGLALYDPETHRLIVHQAGTHPPVSEQAVLGLVLFCLGFPDQALARSKAAIAEARGLAHSPSLAGSLAFGAKLLSLGGDNAILGDWVDQLVAVATEQGFLFWGALGTIYRGWLSVNNGHVAEGILLLRRGSSVYRATGAKTWVPHHISLLARACEIIGQIEEATVLLDDALQIVELTGERWFVAELNRLKGELLQRQEHTVAAEELYRQALSIAREQQAKLWELRAAVSLARLCGEQDRCIEARNLLAPIYCWFTEGFGTPDLKAAKALLDRLM